MDIAERIWSLFGSAIHDLIDRGTDLSDHITEERIFSEIDGWRISGGIDVQQLVKGGVKLLDWKVTSVSKVMMGTTDDWEKQLNIYAYLIEKEKGWTVKGIEAVAILRDWKARDVGRIADYPPSPIHTVQVPLWTYNQREAFLRERIRVHQDAQRAEAWGEELPLCSPEEMWERPASYAVMKSPEAKRATKVLDNLEAAAQLAEQIGGSVVERLGERLRCKSWCEAAPFCSQHQAYLKEKDQDGKPSE